MPVRGHVDVLWLTSLSGDAEILIKYTEVDERGNSSFEIIWLNPKKASRPDGFEKLIADPTYRLIS